MKAMSCDKCRRQREDELHKLQYQVYSNTIDTAIKGVVAVILSDLERRGRTEKYIREFFNNMKMIFDLPSLYDERVSMTDIIARLEEKYRISFDEIGICKESEKEFITAIKKYERMSDDGRKN